MKTYIFYSDEGFTQNKDNDAVENCQVIGWANGNSPDKAFNNLINKESYLRTLGFEKILCQELTNEKVYTFFLSRELLGRNKTNSKNNPTRLFWCKFYLMVGVVLGIIFFVLHCPVLKQALNNNLYNLLWCSAWASLGISLGLYNDRESVNGRASDHIHYITYFPFVLFIAILATFAMTTFDHSLKSYAASALITIAIGFSGDSLAGAMLKLAKK